MARKRWVKLGLAAQISSSSVQGGMGGALPGYYTRLRPFRELFRSGVPILTYHKLGPRPGGVRLKGLYVSGSLFDRQLAELRQAGFRSAGLDQILGCTDNRAKLVVLTFDDGFASVLRYGCEPLARYGFCATVFLVAGRLGDRSLWQALNGEVLEPLMDAAQVREWLAAGHQIGSHTLTHPHLTRLTQAQAREEIAASKKLLEDLFGVPVRHFCYPYGDWNPTVRDWVAAAGYDTACTADWGVNTTATPRFELRRLTARYRSRKLKTLLAWALGRA
jgi:peptidoglycan/xylan/chitin deacetylase (PgdA/CDA1 family)